jgi:hypothetical protein
MSIRPTETARPNGDRADVSIVVVRELADASGRENKRKDGIHPSLRALPDYPAR